MQFHQTQLPNGLTIVGETNPKARSMAVGFFVRTGARDEAADESGVTHFLEHMVFKGTPRRDALQVNRDLDAIGSGANAYTSEENTVFYAAILPEYLPQVVDILTDILRPSLRGEDFETEKGVIINEIAMYLDQPTSVAFDNARQTFFGDHPLGNSILGTKESITALRRDQMHRYFTERYSGGNVTVAAAGNFVWEELEGLIRKHCGDWPAAKAGRSVRPAPGQQKLQVICNPKVVQEHLVLVGPGPAADDPLRFAAEVLANALGDDSGSRLYWALVDPGHADAAETMFHEYEGAGAFYSYVGGDPEHAQANLAQALAVFTEVQEDGLKDEEIQQAKSKIASRIVRASERPMGRMQAVGDAWTNLHRYRTVDDDLRDIDAVTAAQVREVLDRYPLPQLTIVGVGPLEKLERPGHNGKG